MKRTFAIITVVVTVVVIALATLGMYSLFGRDETLSASGTLEARNISVGSKVGGRVSQVLVHEGDQVKAGQVLISFEEGEPAARLLQAQGRFEQAKANYEKMVHGSRPEDIAEARGTADYQEHSSDVYRADIARSKADLTNAQINYDRAVQLAKDGVVSQSFLDDADAKLKMANAAVASYEHALTASQGSIAASEAAKRRAEKGFRVEDIAAAKAEMISAEGDYKVAQTQWDERRVMAPSDSVVEVMDIRPGDLLAANAPIAKLLEANQLYVIVYVPQDQIGKVRLGQAAQVTVDAFPNQPFKGVVEQIRQQAEFLPRNVETKEERVHQVIGVKIRVENPQSKLRAGINAEVKFAPVDGGK